VFLDGQGIPSLALKGDETYTIKGIEGIAPRAQLSVTATRPDGQSVEFDVLARLDTEVEVDYFTHGGILPFVLRKIMAE
jgi:aconitate hydratase